MYRPDLPWKHWPGYISAREGLLRWLRPAPVPETRAWLTPDLVTALLARRGIWLRFPSRLEALFEQETSAARCRLLIWSKIISLLCLAGFMIFDQSLIAALGFHPLPLLLIAIPLDLVAMCIFAVNPRPWIREVTGCMTLFAMTLMIMLMALEMTSHSRAHVPYGVLLVLMFASSVQMLRFPYLPLACAGILWITLLSLTRMDSAALTEMRLLPGLIVGGAILGSVAGFAHERETRIAYLNGMLYRLFAEKLETMSFKDPLTGVGNRRALDKRFSHLASPSSSQTRLAAIMIDIDYFKQFNDTYGHAAGDQCLRQLAAILATELRKATDGVFRMGGEEFLVLLADVDADMTRAIAERMRIAIAHAAIPHMMPRPNSIVTASFGIASGEITTGTDVTPLIKAADAALYASKRSGRDQVSVADPTLVSLFAEAQAQEARKPKKPDYPSIPYNQFKSAS